MAKVISFINEKGGVGKTTTTNVMASILKDKGFKVLCIDFDPQGHLSFGFNADTQSKPTIYDVLKRKVKLREAIQETVITDLVPATDILKSIESEFTSHGNENILKEMIKQVDSLYDYILIDSPPELGLISINALVASNIVLIPCLPDGYSLMGTIKVHETISRIKSAFNPDLRIGGIVLVRYYPREKLSRSASDVLKNLSKTLDIPLLHTKIRHSNILSDSTSVRQLNVVKSISSNTSVQDYMSLTEELLRKGII